MKYLLLFLLPLSLFASKILSYNIYDRTDRVDLMITFDTPYSGVIKQSRSSSKIIIKLEDASIESPKIKKIASKFLQSVTITPLQNETQIIAAIPQKNVKLIASKTADGYGLRLRFTNKSTTAQQFANKNSNTLQKGSALSNLPTKKENDLTQSYIIVIAILTLGILTLLYLKKRVTPTPKKEDIKTKSQWLFKSNNEAAVAENKGNEVSIRFQKAIDEKNSVVMLDFGKESYLVLMGNSNILLDKFHEERPTSQQEFESILQTRHKELEEFLSTNERETPFTQGKEPLQAYKERAASLVYSDEQL